MGKSSPYALEGTGSNKGRQRSHLPAKPRCHVSLRPRSCFRVDTAFGHKKQIQLASSWENSIRTARDKTWVPSLQQVSSIPVMAHCYCRPQNTTGMGFTGISHLTLWSWLNPHSAVSQHEAVEYSYVCLHQQCIYLVTSKFDINVQILLPLLTLEARLSAWLVSELRLGKQYCSSTSETLHADASLNLIP